MSAVKACLARYRSNEGCRAVLYSVGRKWVTAVWIESGGVAAHKIAPVELRSNFTAIHTNTPKKAARAMLRAGRVLSITKEARRFLSGVVNGESNGS